MCNKVLSVCFFLLIFVGCKETTEDNDAVTALRSSMDNAFYLQNNKDAIRRVDSIMYNKTNTSNKYERFKIVHISDPHLSALSRSNNYISPNNLLQSITFANQTKLKINAIVATGDFISNKGKGEALQYLKAFTSNFRWNNKIPSVVCTGNHDSNMIEKISKNYISRSELNNTLFLDAKLKNRNYYYTDVKNPQRGTIRIISLDMIDQPADEYYTLYYAHYSQEQINWLGNVALKEGMTENHSIIILNHYPFQNFSKEAKTYLCDGDFVHSWNMIPEIIEAYRTRSSLNKSYPNKLIKQKNISINFNFSNSTGEFVCYLGGHAHVTTHFDVQGFENENKTMSPQKMLLCTNQAPSEKGVVYNRVERNENSLTSNSFCIYAIDTQEKNIYITFFGAYKPKDNADYQEIQSISYK